MWIYVSFNRPDIIVGYINLRSHGCAFSCSTELKLFELICRFSLLACCLIYILTVQKWFMKCTEHNFLSVVPVEWSVPAFTHQPIKTRGGLDWGRQDTWIWQRAEVKGHQAEKVCTFRFYSSSLIGNVVRDLCHQAENLQA